VPSSASRSPRSPCSSSARRGGQTDPSGVAGAGWTERVPPVWSAVTRSHPAVREQAHALEDVATTQRAERQGEGAGSARARDRRGARDPRASGTGGNEASCIPAAPSCEKRVMVRACVGLAHASTIAACAREPANRPAPPLALTLRACPDDRRGPRIAIHSCRRSARWARSACCRALGPLGALEPAWLVVGPGVRGRPRGLGAPRPSGRSSAWRLR
jgi:hypothetical protein